MKLNALAITLVLLLAFTGAAMAEEPVLVPLHASQVGVTNSGFETKGECPTPPAGQEGWWGWHFIMPTNNNFTSLTVTFAAAGTFSADPFPGGVFVAHPDNSHAYIWTPTDDTLLAGSATSDGNNKFFNLSHVCPGNPPPPPPVIEPLEVSKTVVTSYTRTYNWTIDKVGSVAALTLSPKKTGVVNYSVTVAATYLDSDFVVSGEITIYNPNEGETAYIDTVLDSIDGVPALVACPTLEVAPLDTLVCAYTTGKLAEMPIGDNTVTVTTTGNVPGGSATEAVVFGAPAAEVDECITVKDSKKGTLGTVCAADTPQTFTYSLTVGPYCSNGTYSFVNKATFKTNDTYATGSDSWTVKVTVKTICTYVKPPYYWWWRK